MKKAQSLILTNSNCYNKYEEASGFLKNKDFKKAEKLFREIAETKDPLARKSRMALAAIFIKAENYKNAEELLSKEAAYFLSPKRKKETATVYLELAEKAVAKGAEDNTLRDKVDYDKVLRLYDYLLEQELPKDLLDDILYQRGKIALEAENYGYASNAFFEYLQNFDPSYHSQILGTLRGADPSKPGIPR